MTSYRVRFLHRESDQIARYPWMTKPEALALAAEMVAERERDVQVEDDTGQLWSIDGLAGTRGG